MFNVCEDQVSRPANTASFEKGHASRIPNAVMSLGLCWDGPTWVQVPLGDLVVQTNGQFGVWTTDDDCRKVQFCKMDGGNKDLETVDCR